MNHESMQLTSVLNCIANELQKLLKYKYEHNVNNIMWINFVAACCFITTSQTGTGSSINDEHGELRVNINIQTYSKTSMYKYIK